MADQDRCWQQLGLLQLWGWLLEMWLTVDRLRVVEKGEQL